MHFSLIFSYIAWIEAFRTSLKNLSSNWLNAETSSERFSEICWIGDLLLLSSTMLLSVRVMSRNMFRVYTVKSTTVFLKTLCSCPIIVSSKNCTNPSSPLMTLFELKKSKVIKYFWRYLFHKGFAKLLVFWIIKCNDSSINSRKYSMY